jgi:hypothetical protein
MKMPAFQFYPADWRKDPGVQALDFHDRGVWFEILCIMHESSERGVLLLNGRPMPEPALARMLGLDNQTLNQTLTNLLTYGVASQREQDGALYSRRMVKDENLCQVRREAGKKGGNPNLVKQNPTTGDNQISTPSSSTSSSISSSIKPSLRSGGGRDELGPDEVMALQLAETIAAESPADDASHTEGGAADVGTPVEAPVKLTKQKGGKELLTGDLAELLNPGGVAERVQKMKSPLTQFEADALCAKYGTEAARQIVKEMANYAKLTSNNVSANLTAQKWLDKRNVTQLASQATQQQQRYQPASQMTTRAAAIAGADAMFDALAAGIDPLANRYP